MWTNFANFGTRRSSRVALLGQPCVARCAAIPLRLIVVTGALLLRSSVSPLQTGIPRSTLSKIKQLKIIQLPTIRHFPKSRHPPSRLATCFQYVACGLCNALPHEVVRSSLLNFGEAVGLQIGTLCAISPR